MRILALGDIHGKAIWKQFVENTTADCIVFVGDFIIMKEWFLNKAFRNNLEDLIAFKRANANNVHLLIGNHDMPHLYPSVNVQKIISPRMTQLYRDNEDCFEAAYQNENILFTHAGVTTGWYKKHQSLIESSFGDSLADKLNALHRSEHYAVLHERGKSRGGNFKYGGITYADKEETERGALSGFTQVVGHTKVPKPMKVKVDHGSMVYIDCLNSVAECLLVDDGELSSVNAEGLGTMSLMG